MLININIDRFCEKLSNKNYNQKKLKIDCDFHYLIIKQDR